MSESKYPIVSGIPVPDKRSTGRNMEGENNPSFAHGHASRKGWSPLYIRFMNMKGRCHVKTHKDYARYGNIGIYVCDRWRFGENGRTGFECFVEDMGDIPFDGASLDRIDGTKGYSPDNCRWATTEEQANNRKSCRYLTIDGVTKSVAQWSRVSGIGPKTIKDRLDNQGLTAKEAVFNKLIWTKRIK